ADGRIPGVELSGDHLHRLFELGEGGAVVAEENDAHIGDGGGNFVLQDTQGAGSVAGDEHAVAGGEQMTDEVGDGVRFAGAGRTLHDHAGLGGELRDDFALLFVG